MCMCVWLCVCVKRHEKQPASPGACQCSQIHGDNIKSARSFSVTRPLSVPSKWSMHAHMDAYGITCGPAELQNDEKSLKKTLRSCMHKCLNYTTWDKVNKLYLIGGARRRGGCACRRNEKCPGPCGINVEKLSEWTYRETTTKLRNIS